MASDSSVTKDFRELGIIDHTMLGIEDHGIMSFMLNVKFGSTGQGFGGYALDTPKKDKRGRFLKRQGTAFGCDVILRILGAVGVEEWEELKGKEIWAYRDGNTFASKIIGIEAPAYRPHTGAFFIEDAVKEWEKASR